MSESHENKIKAAIKRELIEQAELVLNNRLLHAQFANAISPSEIKADELQATLIACQELRASLTEIPETSERAFKNLTYGFPHFDFTISKIIKGQAPAESTP